MFTIIQLSLGNRTATIFGKKLPALLAICSFCGCLIVTTRQPLWVILCRLPEKGRREIGDSRGDEREEQGIKENE